MFIREWAVSEASGSFAAPPGLSPLLAQLLELRGFDTPEKVRQLLSPQSLSDPFTIKGMAGAVNRVQEALKNYENIAVYGDYDADGVTATAILYTYLKSVGGRVSFYIPPRDDGYGLNKDAILTLFREGVELIITVDNGISAVEEIDYANELGLDVVVTDHHLPHQRLPKACALVDPHQPGDDSPFRELSGAGLAFMLVTALSQGTELDAMEKYSGLAAIGTIADVVPLFGENRSIVRLGLLTMENHGAGHSPGLEALLRLTKGEMSSTGLAFSLVPCINATGRMGSASRAVRLLTCQDKAAAEALAAELQNDNARRKDVEQQIISQVVRWIEKTPQVRHARIIVAAGRGWHHGVVGIVAARIAEYYGKPCFVLSVNNGVARGSGRSREGFSLIDAIQFCAPLLTQYGGHPMAGGVTMPQEHVAKFREMVNQYAQSHAQSMPLPKLSLDCCLEPHQLTLENAQALRPLEPFGCGNAQPVFGVSGVTIQELRPLGAGHSHTKLVCAKDGCTFQCLRFGVAPTDFSYPVGAVVDLALNMDLNTYRGVEQLSLILRDIRRSGLDARANMDSCQAYEAVQRGENPPAAQELPPSREELVAIYKCLKRHHLLWVDIETLLYELLSQQILLGKLLLSLDIFQERGLAIFQFDRNRLRAELFKTNEKVDIMSSPLLQLGDKENAEPV